MGLNSPHWSWGQGLSGYYPNREVLRNSDPTRSYKLISSVNDFPLTSAQVKEHLKIDSYNAESDAYITQLIHAVVATAEQCTRMEIQPKTFQFYMPRFASYLELKKRPFISLGSIQTQNTDGTWTTADSASYYTVEDGPWARVYPDYGTYWPDLYVTRPDAIKVTFSAGMATPTSTSCPTELQLAMLNHCSVLYEQRGDWGSSDVGVASMIQNLPSYTQLIYNQYRVVNR